MKLKKNPGKEEKQAAAQLRKYLKTDEQWTSLILTYMGIISIMLDHLEETYGAEEKISQLPMRVKYAILQAIMHYNALGEMIRGEADQGEVKFKYIPIEDDAWDNQNKITDRMVVVVKVLHAQLKKEGRL